MSEKDICLICNREGHTSSSCTSPAAKAQRRSSWPTGGIVASQFCADKIKTKHRGETVKAVGGTQDNRQRDTSKFAPKHPKAGKPLPGNRAPKEKVKA